MQVNGNYNNSRPPIAIMFLSRYLDKYSKHVSSGHSKIDKTNLLMTNDSLMKVKSIAECSP